MSGVSIQSEQPPTLKSLLKQKSKAVLMHFSISLAVFIVLLYFLLFEWFPYPFFTAAGGWEGLKILAVVDLILGPLLTMIIFNPKKSWCQISFDFSCIGIIQISAMVWGIYNIYLQHTAAVVFWENEFYAVPYKLYKQQNISLGDIENFSHHHPPLIYAEFPKDSRSIKNLQQKNADGIPAFAHKGIYHPIDSYYEKIYKHKLNIHEIIANNNEMKTATEKFLAAENSNIEDYIYIGLKAKFHNVVLVFKDNKIISTLNAPYSKQ